VLDDVLPGVDDGVLALLVEDRVFALLVGSKPAVTMASTWRAIRDFQTLTASWGDRGLGKRIRTPTLPASARMLAWLM
jgi:hypothetical protein